MDRWNERQRKWLIGTVKSPDFPVSRQRIRFCTGRLTILTGVIAVSGGENFHANLV